MHQQMHRKLDRIHGLTVQLDERKQLSTKSTSATLADSLADQLRTTSLEDDNDAKDELYDNIADEKNGAKEKL